jgi:glyoxylase-like metal-dependent hydrolase (beta-lactamase superfamily II)
MISKRFQVEALTDCIYLIKGENISSFPPSYSILIRDEEVVLIDTGCGIENLKKIKKEYGIDYVINSHAHPDHAAGNWVFEGRPIHVPEEGFGASGNIAALAEVFSNEELAQLTQGYMRDLWRFRNCRPTESYNERTVFRIGKTTLKPIYTPGHSKDHYCLYEPNEGILFSFDYDLTLFPWYGLRESSIPEFRESVKKLKALSPKVVVSSHRGVVTGDIAAEFDRFCQRIDARGEKILSLLGSAKTIEQLVELAPIYGSFPYMEPLLRFWEAQMISKHLEQLEIDGRVKRHGDLYSRS